MTNEVEKLQAELQELKIQILGEWHKMKELERKLHPETNDNSYFG